MQNGVAADLKLLALWQAADLNKSTPLNETAADQDGWAAPSNNQAAPLPMAAAEPTQAF